MVFKHDRELALTLELEEPRGIGTGLRREHILILATAVFVFIILQNVLFGTIHTEQIRLGITAAAQLAFLSVSGSLMYVHV